MDGTPFGRDIIAELAEACHKHGLKLGLYYSQAIDWRERHGGGYTSRRTYPDANNQRGTVAGLEGRGAATRPIPFKNDPRYNDKYAVLQFVRCSDMHFELDIGTKWCNI